MFLLYSFLYSLAFLLILPLFLLRREKYASGFSERLGKYPKFDSGGRPVIWLHCVSVGETNAARPLVSELQHHFPDHRLVISTTTKTGQELARDIFRDNADAVIYFPFDWRFSVRRALDNFHPSVVLLMETEIWPRLIHEAKQSGAKVVIVNGRLSQRSFEHYSKVRTFVKAVLGDVDLALMQNEKDAERISTLGLNGDNVRVIGNLKFDHSLDEREIAVASELRDRFGISGDLPLVVAASTHEPEEKLVIDSLRNVLSDFRLLIAPRHPQRFDDVANLVKTAGLSIARRSEPARDSDKDAKVILLDSIGELRGAYRLAAIVFVGGSLIPHGGQSILEPAAAGKAIITGPFTHNFAAVIDEFKKRDAVIQLRPIDDQKALVEELTEAFSKLLNDSGFREELAQNAAKAMKENEGVARKTVDLLSGLVTTR